MPKIFISYRRDDSIAMAGRIDDRLVSRFGRDSVFRDLDAISLGDYRIPIANAINECDVLLALIGEQWLTTSKAGGADWMIRPIRCDWRSKLPWSGAPW